jgi:hypothetical protein
MKLRRGAAVNRRARGVTVAAAPAHFAEGALGIALNLPVPQVDSELAEYRRERNRSLSG